MWLRPMPIWHKCLRQTHAAPWAGTCAGSSVMDNMRARHCMAPQPCGPGQHPRTHRTMCCHAGACPGRQACTYGTVRCHTAAHPIRQPHRCGAHPAPYWVDFIVPYGRGLGQKRSGCTSEMRVGALP